MILRYIDTFSYKEGHSQINAAFLVMYSLIYDKVYYYAGNSSSKHVFSLIKDGYDTSNIVKKRIFVCKGTGRLALLLRYIISAFQNIRLLFISTDKDVLFYNFNNLFSLRALNFLNKFLHRKVLVCCHGELELLISRRNKNGLLHKSLSFLVKDFFLNKRKLSDNFYFIVLGDIIKDNLKNILDESVSERIISIDHSYIFTKREHSKKKNEDNRIHIGTVGAFSESKGANLFVSLVTNTGNPQIKFSITGGIYYDINKLKTYNIDIPNNGYMKPLPQVIFDERVNTLDYIIFLYDTNSYQLTASGAVMDAINLRKPILSLKNRYFKYLFEKYGALGMLFDDCNQLENYLSNLDPSQLISVDFDKIQEKLSPQFLYKTLRSSLFMINFC